MPNIREAVKFVPLIVLGIGLLLGVLLLLGAIPSTELYVFTTLLLIVLGLLLNMGPL